MNAQTTIQELTDLAEDYKRIALLKREIATLKAVNAKVGETQHWLNRSRIASRQSELESLELLTRLIEEDGGIWTDDGQFIAI